jgi:hypothetical protein
VTLCSLRCVVSVEIKVLHFYILFFIQFHIYIPFSFSHDKNKSFLMEVPNDNVNCERWTLCERWTNGERRTLCERWTNAERTVNERFVIGERTLNERWTNAERTVNERKNGKVERFRDCNSLWTNSVSREYRNKSVNKGAQLVPIEIPSIFWNTWSSNSA